jgi:hypothetical protein
LSSQSLRATTWAFLSVGGLALSALLAFYPMPAQAYVGPPAALGMLGLVVGLGMTMAGMLFHWLVKATRHVLRGLSSATAAPPVE